MILQVFAVYDSKLKAFMIPFFQQNTALAIRAFKTGANDPGSQLCGHPEDFSLHHLGAYDDETADFKLHIPPVNLGLASNFKVSAHVQHENA